MPPESASLIGEARDLLLASQCNCPYWHGVFGGLYLPHIRHAVFHNLLGAEALLDRAEGTPHILVDVTDYNFDGRPEVLVETPLVDWYFTPDDGAKLIELDFKPSAYNLLNTLTRREEGYHARVAAAVVHSDQESEGEESKSIHDAVLAKEAGLAALIHYDWYRKGSFIEHLLGPGATLDGFLAADYEEQGDFVDQPWQFHVENDCMTAAVRFHRSGGFWRDGLRHPVLIEKQFLFHASTAECEVEYRVTNTGDRPADLRFGVELNFNLLSGDAPDKYYLIDGVDLGDDNKMASKGEVRGARWCAVTNEWDRVAARIDADLPATIWRGPIETVSLSEDGFERTHQGATLLLLWDILLTDVWTVNLRCRLSDARIGE